MRPSILIALAAMTALPSRALLAQADDSKVTLPPARRGERRVRPRRADVEVGDYKIHASRREGPGMAEIHTRDTDIAYVLQGSATLVTGGTALDVKPIGPEELRGSGIRAATPVGSSSATSS